MVSLAGVGAEWETCAATRNFFRSSKRVFQGLEENNYEPPAHVKSAVLNVKVLEPVIRRMGQAAGKLFTIKQAEAEFLFT